MNKLKKIFCIGFFALLTLILLGFVAKSNEILVQETSVQQSDISSQSSINQQIIESPADASAEANKPESIPSLIPEELLKQESASLSPAEIIVANSTQQENANATEQENNTYFEYIDIDKIVIENLSKTENNSVGAEQELIKSTASETPSQIPVLAGAEIKNIYEKNNNSVKEETQEEKKVDYILFKNGEKEIETKIQENSEIKIEKIESVEVEEKENWAKKVKVFSQEHFENQLTIYTNIAESKKEEIRIYWIKDNIQEDITENPLFNLQFYDTDENSLIDKISWTVPHLSEQNFKIIINFSLKEQPNTPLSLIAISPKENEIIGNPIIFRFNISYSSLTSLNCTLAIDSEQRQIEVASQNFSWPSSLDNGIHNWKMNCKDKSNESIFSEKSGNFYINASFDFLLSDNLIQLGKEINLTIYSGNAASKLELKKPDNSILTYTISGSYPYVQALNSSTLNQDGIYIINLTSYYFDKPTSIVKSFSVARIQFYSSKDNLKENESIRIFMNISSPLAISWYMIDFNDTQFSIPQYPSSTSVSSYLDHVYQKDGNYTPKIMVMINNKILMSEIKIKVNKTGDTEPPQINLISPDDGEVIRTNNVNFIYSANDNAKIINCTLELYNKTNIFSVLAYSKTDKNLQNNQNIGLILNNLKEGEYLWNVGCYDNSSNYAEEEREFIIDMSNLTILLAQNSSNQQENLTYPSEIADTDMLISKINIFMEKMDSFSLEEKEVVEDLGIYEELNSEKKKLIQIQLDLKDNLKFITDPVQKEKRITEIINYIKEAKEKVPESIKVVDNKEFVKNSITSEMESIVKNYTEAKKITLDKAGIKRLAQANSNLQNELSVSALAKHVELSYDGKIKKITLITKKISLKNNNSGSIIEVIPKSIASDSSMIKFEQEVNVINSDPILEILQDNIKNSKIVYYIEDFVELKKAEDIDTILFKESSAKDSIGITGFFLFDLGSENRVYYPIILLMSFFVVFLLISGLKRVRISQWKKEEDVRVVFELLKESKKALANENIEKARESYYKIRELYPLLPEGCRKFLYKDINKILIEIDKRDAKSILKEYETVSKENRKEDAAILYSKLQKIYSRLPAEYKERIYNRLSLIKLQ